MPSITELSRDATHGAIDGLIDYGTPILPLGHPFTDIQAANWSSTETPPGPEDWVWIVLPSGMDGMVTPNDKDSEGVYIWPCRGP